MGLSMPHPPWLATAFALQGASRFGDAERLYWQVLQHDPNEADALHMLGLAAAARGDLDEAERLIARAVAAKPNRADLHASLGNLFYAREQGPKMAECYRRALLLAYWGEIPAPFPDIIAYAGSNPGPSDFPAGPAQYRSQFVQDVLIDRWVFGGLRDGIFVDIGAHDGVTLSNSYFFETVRGWRGLAVEPNPNAFAQASANRRCTVLNCCVADRPGKAQFLKISGHSEMLSGMIGHYDPDHLKRIETEARTYGGTAETISVETRTLNDIAAEAEFTEIHYLSVDTEGSELSILSGCDFGRLLVHALTVECNFEHAKARMVALLAGHGFAHIHTLGHDLVFLNRKSPYFAAFNRLRTSAAM
jgi:FkbM family methyltransferase